MDDTTPPRENGLTMQRPVIVVILYLLNFALGFSVIVGVVLAYVWRGEERTLDWEKTHYTYLIRTFWMGLAIFVVAFFVWFTMIFGVAFASMDQAAAGGGQAEPPLAMFGVMFAMMGLFFLSAAWFTARCIISLVKASERKPMPRPTTWLF